MLYKAILVQFLLFSFSIAKIPPNVTATVFSEIDEEEDTCMLSVLPPDPKSMCCGVDLSSSNWIVGGAPTGINQYPWMALINYKNRDSGNIESKCGGSLISSLYVLTAAHCVTEDDNDSDSDDVSEPYSVVLGDYDKNHDGPDCVIMRGQEICSDGETTIRIAKIILHPEYRRKSTRYAHDIALIELAAMAPYTDDIRPICLPSFDINKHPLKDFELIVAGWGTMKQVYEGTELIDTPSAVKRHLLTPFINNKRCKKMSGKNTITKSQVCAGGLKGKGDCAGDSGGPLMFNNGGQFEVTGVVSFGFGDLCGDKEPDVYTNVFKYKKWIFSVIHKGMA